MCVFIYHYTIFLSYSRDFLLKTTSLFLIQLKTRGVNVEDVLLVEEQWFAWLLGCDESCDSSKHFLWIANIFLYVTQTAQPTDKVCIGMRK